MIAADASLSLLRVCNRNLTTKQGVYDFASEFGILPVSGSSPPGRQRQQQQQQQQHNNNNHLSSSFGFDIIDGACVCFVFRVLLLLLFSFSSFVVVVARCRCSVGFATTFVRKSIASFLFADVPFSLSLSLCVCVFLLCVSVCLRFGLGTNRTTAAFDRFSPRRISRDGVWRQDGRESADERETERE
jgi:hypothetical protein